MPLHIFTRMDKASFSASQWSSHAPNTCSSLSCWVQLNVRIFITLCTRKLRTGPSTPAVASPVLRKDHTVNLQVLRSHSLFNPEKVIGLPCCKGALLALPSGLQSCFPAIYSPASTGHVVTPPQVQDLVFPSLNVLTLLLFAHFFSLLRFLWQHKHLLCQNFLPSLQIICKFAFRPIIKVITEDIKLYWPQQWPLGNATTGWPSSGLHASNHNL